MKPLRLYFQILFLAGAAGAANVGPSGYTDAFPSQPAAADWATASIAGTPADGYDMDADVNARIAATNVVTQINASAANPIGLGLRASWSSSGQYLGTRPNGNRYAVFLGRFTNAIGSNATSVAISYRQTIAGNATAEEPDKGTRVYFSLTGDSNTWINLETLNTTATNGSSVVGTNLTIAWPHGAGLHLLWVDDNAAAGNDVAFEIDDFSLLVTGHAPLPVAGSLASPEPNAVFAAGAAVQLAAEVRYGNAPYVVQFWTNNGVANAPFDLAGAVSLPPYGLVLTGLAAGAYHVYATITDAGGIGETFVTATNRFHVAEPLAVAVASPIDGAEIDHNANVVAAASVAGGTPPYTAQFFLNGVSNGPPVASPPYTRDFDLLPIGYHTVHVLVTDAAGWSSNSALNTFRVTGPLSVTLFPPSGTELYVGSRLILGADITGGEPPYSVTVRMDGEVLASMNFPPFAADAGTPAAGAHAASIHVTDSSVPAQLVVVTNVIHIAPLPPARATHAVQMSLDGLGALYLQFYLTNAPAEFPNFGRLTREGAFTLNARCDYDISETVPNHVTMFTGRPVFPPAGHAETVHHGYNNNFPGGGDTLHISGNDAVPYKASVFDVAHDFGLATALLTGKTRLAICERSYNEINGAPDSIGEDNGRDKIDFASVADVSGQNISNEVSLLVADLESPNPKRYTFIHIAEPDLTGHSSGWGSANWSNIVRTVDAQLGRVLEAIDGNPILSNNTALIITADHGGGGVLRNAHTESYHITNYTVPFFVRAPGVPPGADIYSVLANRGNPGTNRTDYVTQPQPVRNGDASNLALRLLGLPPIEGSFLVPVLAEATVSLSVARFGDNLAVFWNDSADEYALEATQSVGPDVSWEPVMSGLETNDITRVYRVTNVTEVPGRFFRLQKVNP